MNNIETIQKVSRPSHIKLKLFLLLVILAAGGYGYLRYQDFRNMLAEADRARVENQTLQVTATNYDKLKQAIADETSRCQSFIAAEQGNFGDFEYCQKFLDWAGKQ